MRAALLGFLPCFPPLSSLACRVPAFAPNPLLLQGIGDLARHVAFVMLGENTVGMKDFVHAKRALRDDTLTFPEEIGQKPGVCHFDLLFGVGHSKTHRVFALVQERALLDEAADTQPLAFMRRFLRKLAW